MKRPQQTFIFFDVQLRKIERIRARILRETGKAVTQGFVVRYCIRLCPSDRDALNHAAMEALDDDLRYLVSSKTRFARKRISCTLSDADHRTLRTMRDIVTPVMGQNVSILMLGRMAVNLASDALLVLQVYRTVYFDDFRRKKTSGPDPTSDA